MIEAMLHGMADSVLGSNVVKYQGEEFDFGSTFKRMTVEEVIAALQSRFDMSTRLRDRDYLVGFARSSGSRSKTTTDPANCRSKYSKKTGENNLREPTFVTQYPTEVSPLSRCNDDDPFVTDRFEFFIAGREIANGFSELNDPEDQAERFRAQVANRDAGDDEAMASITTTSARWSTACRRQRVSVSASTAW